MPSIENYLKSCSELSRFCSRNGWIDNDSLRFTVIVESDHELYVDIEFDELLMEGSGSRPSRVYCFGQLHLVLDRSGRIIRAEAL
jgi:hypothetical protein